MSRASSSALTRWWWERPGRERAWLSVAGVAALLLAGWLLVHEPLAREVARTEEAIRTGRLTLALARQRADEASMLAREDRATPSGDPRAAFGRAVNARGLDALVTSVDMHEGSVRASFAAIPVDALTLLVDSLGRDERLFPVELTLIGRVEPSTVRAEIVLRR